MFKELFENKQSMKQRIESLLDKEPTVFVELYDKSFAYVEDISGETVYFADANIVGYKQFKYMEANISEIKRIVGNK